MNGFDWLAIVTALAATLAGVWMWLDDDDDFEAALQGKPVHVRPAHVKLQCWWLKKRLARIERQKAELAAAAECIRHEQCRCDTGRAETSAKLRRLGCTVPSEPDEHAPI